jgi:LacI family transcriptional regulator
VSTISRQHVAIGDQLGGSVPGRATMNDVARTAGVSLKTVSRVVNGEPTVAPDLVERVRAAVESLNYRPHVVASLLRRGDRRSGTVGLLLEDVAKPFPSRLQRAVEDEARTRGVQVLSGSLDEDPERERELVRAFTLRRADGLILTPTGPDQGHLTTEVQGDTPVVFVDRAPAGFAGDAVLSTNVRGASEAVRHLIAHGHRRIAYLGDWRGISTARSRQQGYLDALGGLPARAVDGLRNPAAAEAATLTLLDGPDPPTALFTGQALITVGAVRALRRRGLQAAVALVGFDDLPLGDLLEPPLTAMAQDPVAMGRTAARALFARIDGEAGPPREFLIPTVLVRRGSGEIPPPG